MAKKTGAGGKPQEFNEVNGQFTSDSAGGTHEATPAERKRLRELGIKSTNKFELPKKEYAALCSAIRTKYADKIPTNGQLLYGNNYYQFRYNKNQEKIVFTFKLKIEGNEETISDLMEIKWVS